MVFRNWLVSLVRAHIQSPLFGASELLAGNPERVPVDLEVGLAVRALDVALDAAALDAEDVAEIKAVVGAAVGACA